ncbi:14161_t:CDS:2, partial [Ambispora leptoticha]
KLVICGVEGEAEGRDIQELLEDYGVYSVSKNWNDDKKQQVIRLNITNNLKSWIYEQIKTNTTWADLKTAVIKDAHTSCDKEEKLE